MDESLERKVEVMKKEIDAIQISLAEPAKPWYQNMSTVLAVVALLFSFGTTYVSYRRTALQDVLSTRQDLRGLLQRLAALPKENVEIQKTYSGDAIVMGQISGLINQENSFLARQAAELAKRLPDEMLTAGEYHAIAVALQNAYDLKGAAEFIRSSIRAADIARDFNTEISAVRVMANLLFIQGHPESGRVEYQKALDIFSKYPDYDPFTRSATHIWTELSWAISEANAGYFPLAKQHVGNAEGHLAGLPPSPGVERLNDQISQTRSMIFSASP